MNYENRILNDVESNELSKIKLQLNALCKEYNLTTENDLDKRSCIYSRLFGKFGKNLQIRAPFTCEYGKNIFLGDNVYMNFDCKIEDFAQVVIGNNTLFAPYVQIRTLEESKNEQQFNIESKRVLIGNSVWVGGGVTIYPGVSIGDNVTIGAGSVVKNDIPSNCVAVGNPCKVLRYLNNQKK